MTNIKIFQDYAPQSEIDAYKKLHPNVDIKIEITTGFYHRLAYPHAEIAREQIYPRPIEDDDGYRAYMDDDAII